MAQGNYYFIETKLLLLTAFFVNLHISNYHNEKIRDF